MRNAFTFLSEIRGEKDDFEDRGVHGRIILKLILNKQAGWVGTGLI
jgi:hypothetical protein